MIKVAAVQFKIDSDMAINYHKTCHFIQEAAQHGAQLVAFPESQFTHYVPQYPGLDPEQIALPLTHPYIQGIQASCRANHILASIGACLKIDGKIYAANILIDENGTILAVGTKNHIVLAPHFYEADYFTPGNTGFQVVETSIGKIGMIVCFDRHYPESFRTCALKGAQFVIVPVANEKTEPNEIFQWEMRIPAFQNSLNVLMCNRVGQEGAMDFCGESVFVNPDGTINALANDQEQILYAQLDLAACAQLRAEKQYLPRRRPEAFK